MTSILELPTGLHPDIPHEVYHRRELGLVSKSALDKIQRTPAHYKAWIDGADDDESTEALEFGGNFHCALLEPNRFAASYVVEPDFGDCRFKEVKAKRDDWRRENNGKKLLSTSDDVEIKGMVAAIQRHPLAAKMLEDGLPELTMRWTDPETGLPCKTRADFYRRRFRMAVDVKTAFDASESAFTKSVAKYRYHVTDALYRAGFAEAGEPIEHYVFVVVEKKPPYAVAVYTLDADAIMKGHSLVTNEIRLLADCVRNNEWPAYGTGIKTLTLPKWAA